MMGVLTPTLTPISVFGLILGMLLIPLVTAVINPLWAKLGKKKQAH